jgi:Arc/MetJ family transcription regulator
MKRMTLDLDLDLVAEAAAVLGTTTPSDTVAAALKDVLRHKRLEEMREPRSFGRLRD